MSLPLAYTLVVVMQSGVAANKYSATDMAETVAGLSVEINHCNADRCSDTVVLQ
jgi:hypothetical protein